MNIMNIIYMHIYIYIYITAGTHYNLVGAPRGVGIEGLLPLLPSSVCPPPFMAWCADPNGVCVQLENNIRKHFEMIGGKQHCKRFDIITEGQMCNHFNFITECRHFKHVRNYD